MSTSCLRNLITLSICLLAVNSLTFAQTKNAVKKKPSASVASKTKSSTPKPPPAVPAFQSNTNNAFFPTPSDQSNDEYYSASKYRISDASFIVLPKQKFVRYGLMLRPDRTEKVLNDKGFILNTTTQSLWNIVLDGEYGLTPNLRIGLILNWQIIGNQYYKVAGLPESKTYKNGFYDPELKLIYRLLDSTNSVYNSDFAIHYTPSLGTAKAAYPDQAGNVVYGASQLKIAADLIMPDPNWEWIFGARVMLHGTSKVKGTNDANSYDLSSYTNYWVEATSRKHFLVRYFADLGAEIRMPYTNVSTYKGAPAVTYTEEIPIHVAPKITIGRELSGEGMVRLTYRYEGYLSDARTTTTTTNVASQREISEGTLLAELDLLY